MKKENKDRLILMLQPVRFRPSRKKKHYSDGRTPFDSDFARVALSASVRRLQDKTQVFPLADYDFVRNRLTHSIEVMTMARGLGLGVEKMLAEREGFNLFNGDINDPLRNSISKILEVSALVHDIGNPPYGHNGETAVQNYFKSTESFGGKVIRESNLKEEQIADFKNIEGNVQGFRILRRLALSDDRESFNVTMPVMATIIKYPFSSVVGNKKKEGAFKKKFGYLDSESQEYLKICEQLNINPGDRYPLTFLLEAADDITYNACDLEDGFKEGNISIKQIKDAITADIVNGDTDIMQYVDELSDGNDQLTNEILMQKLRIEIQSKMIMACTEEFVNKIDDIIEGHYSTSLLQGTHLNRLSDVLGNLDVNNFNSRQVKEKEEKGIKEMLFLLDGFTRALTLLNEETPHEAPEYLLYEKISPNYRKAACEEGANIPSSIYNKLLLVTDYIFGMTDSFVHTVYEDEEIGELILRVKCKIDNQK